MESQIVTVEPASLPGKAIAYNNNRWDKLTKNLNNRELENDNNFIENSICPYAFGIKNFLFSGNPDAANNKGVCYSILVSCKSFQINPSNYLSWYLQNINNTKINQREKLISRNCTYLNLLLVECLPYY